MTKELPSLYQQYIHLSRYSRFRTDLGGRRETWEETVNRYFDFFTEHLKEFHNYDLSDKERQELTEAILNLEVMPSMRALMSAGHALKRDNMAGFNCSFLTIDSPKAFDELLYILMCGTGVGFSVERQFVTQLPIIADEFHPTETTIVVPDSKMGWAKSFKELVHLLYGGQIPKWDLTRLRPAGAVLKTFGGRSSGPEPLDELFKFTVDIFRNAAGRKLTSVECHDICCKIGTAIVVGGVRRSALISLSNLTDTRMRNAKSGNWWETEPQRALANNSVAYTEKPDIGIFMDEWKSLYESKSGERGIFNRVGAVSHAISNERRDLTGHEDALGTNPCGEILLRGSGGLCNLSEAVIRHDDTEETLKRKVRLATILGTFQSTLTNYRYVNKKWNTNAQEERLLGVSLTGIMDNTLTNGRKIGLEKLLQNLKQVAIDTNKEYAKKLGVAQSSAITTVKPSGTVSALVDSGSGIHPRHSRYYLRNVRADKTDPLAKMMIDAGVPYEDDVMNPNHMYVFTFPIKSPRYASLKDDLSAIEQLELYRIYKRNYSEHNISLTVSVREEEWMEVGAWVYKHFNDINGVSFLPHTGSIYRQMPFEECDKEKYDEFIKKMPDGIDWSKLTEYESEDLTTGSQELNCAAAGGCEI